MQPIVLDVEAVAIQDAETYLEPVSAPSNYRDPDKIAAYEQDAKRETLAKAALDVDLARIIAVGLKVPDQPTFVMTLHNTSEAQMLTTVWETWHDYRDRQPMLVTFNGLGYDVPLLLRRSLYLGIQAPYISCDKYRHPQQLDLMAILSMDGKLKYHGLQFYLQRFGYPKAGTDITGAEIAARYAAGDWDAIEQHCRQDVEGTAWLAERIGAVPKRQTAEAF